MTELKSCPFCGGEATIFPYLSFGNLYMVICRNCNISRVGKSEGEAVKEWNNRPSPWHKGEPTEEGWYQIAIRFRNRIEYDSRKCRRIIDNNGNECMRFDGCNPVLAWQKIDEYKEEDNG